MLLTFLIQIWSAFTSQIIFYWLTSSSTDISLVENLKLALGCSDNTFLRLVALVYLHLSFIWTFQELLLQCWENTKEIMVCKEYTLQLEAWSALQFLGCWSIMQVKIKDTLISGTCMIILIIAADTFLRKWSLCYYETKLLMTVSNKIISLKSTSCLFWFKIQWVNLPQVIPYHLPMLNFKLILFKFS